MWKILLGAAVVFLALQAVAQADERREPTPIFPGGVVAEGTAQKYVVRLKDGAVPSEFAASRGRIVALNTYLIPRQGVPYLRAEDVVYIEPEVKMSIDIIPDDPLWPQQWGPAKIGAPEAWDTTTGSPDVLIAVVDTGVDYNHPDIAANYMPGGYDFLNGDDDPIDDHSHGTHVAGTIAATTFNGLGVAGMCPDCRVMAEKVLSQFGSGTSFQVAAGVVHATDFGADIINMSLGGGFSQVGEDATNYAFANGVLVVSACGNSAGQNCIFPAGHANSMAISCSTSTDEICGFSSRGSRVDVSAPGTNILSTILNNVYGTKSGTSMSTPHVAGTAALALSLNPALTNEQLWGLLQLTAIQPLSEEWNSDHGFGTVNAAAVVAGALSPPDTRLPKPAEPTPTITNTPGPTPTPTATTPPPVCLPTPEPTATPRRGAPQPTACATVTPGTPGPTFTPTPAITATPTDVPSLCEVLVRLDGVEDWLEKPLAFCS